MFTVKFNKETETPLKPLYEQIVRDYLGNMPVYRDTLVRGGTMFVAFLIVRSRFGHFPFRGGKKAKGLREGTSNCCWLAKL